ncbi:hypothetical protein [uncultured Methylobacterium sp.]|uniref:hypothetical protein n=1 Tax=uncultured Methylobacterium sp. TaxID=157278 RepID=UPI002638ED22|nr:hypothetical protein [uncultured Methylobacterium sp.]
MLLVDSTSCKQQARCGKHGISDDDCPIQVSPSRLLGVHEHTDGDHLGVLLFDWFLMHEWHFLLLLTAA